MCHFDGFVFLFSSLRQKTIFFVKYIIHCVLIGIMSAISIDQLDIHDNSPENITQVK